VPSGSLLVAASKGFSQTTMSEASTAALADFSCFATAGLRTAIRIVTAASCPRAGNNGATANNAGSNH